MVWSVQEGGQKGVTVIVQSQVGKKMGKKMLQVKDGRYLIAITASTTSCSPLIYQVPQP